MTDRVEQPVSISQHSAEQRGGGRVSLRLEATNPIKAGGGSKNEATSTLGSTRVAEGMVGIVSTIAI